MIKARSIRRFMFPCALTITSTAAGIILGAWPFGPQTASAQLRPACSNTECQGVSLCRYYINTNCAIAHAGNSCTNSYC